MNILWAILRAAELLLLIRAVLSWFPVAEEFYEVLDRITEPIIFPMRILFDKLGIGAALPIDLPFLFTFILIVLLESIIRI